MTFSEKVVYIIQNIPKGKVLTYGSIAQYAGNPRASRQVSYILHSSSGKYSLPWHRVVGKDGMLKLQDPLGKQMQIDLLSSEDIEIQNNTIIDFEHVQWRCDLDLQL